MASNGAEFKTALGSSPLGAKSPVASNLQLPQKPNFRKQTPNTNLGFLPGFTQNAPTPRPSIKIPKGGRRKSGRSRRSRNKRRSSRRQRQSRRR